MTEAQFQSKLLKALRSHPALKDAVIWKMNDRYTKGIPDILVFCNDTTTFLEVKIWPNKPTKIQQYYLDKLRPASYTITRLRNGDITVQPWSYARIFKLEEIADLCTNDD